MITLTLTAPSHQELRAIMREFLGMDKEVGPQPGALSIGQGPQMTRTEIIQRVAEKVANASPAEMAQAVMPAQSDVFESDKTAAPEPAKRKRRTKAEIEAAKTNGVVNHNPAAVEIQTSRAEEAPAPSAAPTVKLVSKEAAHQALQQVNVAVGLPKAREILTSFNAQRISDVKEQDYPALIEKCNAAVMMA